MCGNKSDSRRGAEKAGILPSCWQGLTAEHDEKRRMFTGFSYSPEEQKAANFNENITSSWLQTHSLWFANMWEWNDLFIEPATVWALCEHVCLCVLVCVYVACLPVCVSMCTSVYLCLCLCLSVYVCVCLYVFVSVCVYVSAYVTVFPCCPHVCQRVYTRVCV